MRPHRGGATSLLRLLTAVLIGTTALAPLADSGADGDASGVQSPSQAADDSTGGAGQGNDTSASGADAPAAAASSTMLDAESSGNSTAESSAALAPGSAAAAPGPAAAVATNGTAANSTAAAGNGTAAAAPASAAVQEEASGDPRVRSVATRSELLDALKADGVQHIVLSEHLNYTEPFGEGALLSAAGPTRVVRGNCAKPVPTTVTRTPGQCVLDIMQPLLNHTIDEQPFVLLNMYARVAASSGGAPPVQLAAGDAIIATRNNNLLLANVTIEGAGSATSFASNASGILVTSEASGPPANLSASYVTVTGMVGRSGGALLMTATPTAAGNTASLRLSNLFGNSAPPGTGIIDCGDNSQLRLVDSLVPEGQGRDGPVSYAGTLPLVYATPPIQVTRTVPPVGADLSGPASAAPPGVLLDESDATFTALLNTHFELTPDPIVGPPPTPDVNDEDPLGDEVVTTAATEPAAGSDDESLPNAGLWALVASVILALIVTAVLTLIVLRHRRRGKAQAAWDRRPSLSPMSGEMAPYSAEPFEGDPDSSGSGSLKGPDGPEMLQASLQGGGPGGLPLVYMPLEPITEVTNEFGESTTGMSFMSRVDSEPVQRQ